MIQPNEFRIGNYVDFYGRQQQICKEDFSLPIMPFKPLILTEEWLLKFGFEKKQGIMYWEKEGIEIVYETLAGFYRLYPRVNPIKYVHQLQNLFFALTEEELF